MAPISKPKRKRDRHFIREWRIFREKNQSDIAEALDVNQSSISNLENGKTPYDQDVLERLAIYFGCDPQDLISINPLAPDAPRLVYSKVRSASPEKQREILAVVEAMLKAS